MVSELLIRCQHSDWCWVTYRVLCKPPCRWVPSVNAALWGVGCLLPNRSGRKRWEMYRANKATLEWPSPHPGSSEKLNHIWLTQNRTLLFQAVRCSSANKNISHLYDVCSLAGYFHTALSQLTCIPTIYSSRADSLYPWSASIEVHTLRWAGARTQPPISL